MSETVLVLLAVGAVCLLLVTMIRSRPGWQARQYHRVSWPTREPRPRLHLRGQTTAALLRAVLRKKV